MSSLKRPLDINVLDAARERIATVFEHFPKICVSFSGGKDSSVMLHLVMEEAIKRRRKVALLFIDLEAQYTLTVEHIAHCFDLYREHIEPFWVALPLSLRNAVSMYEPRWMCWDPERRADWVREMPPQATDCLFPFFQRGMEFEEFVEKFGNFYGDGKLTACFVGIRADESLNRFRTLIMEKTRFENHVWTTWKGGTVYNAYPLYDWRTEDLWTFYAKTGHAHNRLYDLMHKAGLSIHQMRICQPYGDDQRKGLWLYHVLEPNTWSKVIARVNGANSGSLYAAESGDMMGNIRIKKPNGHSWESFARLLLETLPPKSKEHFENKVETFLAWWKDRGYHFGIPDEAEPKLEAAKKAPSWRMICKVLLKNDYWCKGFSFTATTSKAYGQYTKVMRNRKRRGMYDSKRGYSSMRARAFLRPRAEPSEMMMNVFEAAQERIGRIFGEFDNIYVSFSGGKDSGVLLNLCLNHIRTHGYAGKFNVFHIDYEAKYQQTTDYVDETLAQLDCDVYRCCLPIAAQCATSMLQQYWLPWDPEAKDLWVRPLPEHAITLDNCPFSFFAQGMWDYYLQEQFGKWLHDHNHAQRTCCLVGIRTQESLNRWRTIHAAPSIERYCELNWTSVRHPNVINAYPLYDWKAADVWTANARNGWRYNHLYNLFHMAGLSVDQMRVASPFNDCAKESLHLYQAIDPRNWGRMVGRVNGVNFTGIYGGTTAMGWRSIKLPAEHTWKSYYEFLLSTLPNQIRRNYETRFAVSVRFWREVGGCLSEETITDLRAMGVKLDDSGTTNRRTTKRPVRMDYMDDVDLPAFRELPSYKRMCVCILKNDHMCKYMGFSPTRTDMENRERAMQKYKGVL